MSDQTLQAPSRAEIRRGTVRWVTKSEVFTLILGAVLFLLAGRLDWWYGWLYLGLVFGFQLINALVFIPTRPELLAERSKAQPGAKGWDFVLASIMAYTSLIIGIVAALDARWHWSPDIPWVVSILATVVAAAGGLFTQWAMVANPFFSGLVRIQSERGHVVVSTGPYRWLRHPGYLGALIFAMASPLILGSLWAFVPAVISFVNTLVRTALEDRTLRAELPGYDDYARQVRYRLVPGVW
jgi:protein-S-isoprenylcysteine O-methyltransferase Ste14